MGNGFQPSHRGMVGKLLWGFVTRCNETAVDTHFARACPKIWECNATWLELRASIRLPGFCRATLGGTTMRLVVSTCIACALLTPLHRVGG